MASAATRLGSIWETSWRSASVAARHQSLASCSNQPASGERSATAARPSAIALPFASQAIALVAVVELSIPITRSPDISSFNERQKNGGGQDRLLKVSGRD